MQKNGKKDRIIGRLLAGAMALFLAIGSAPLGVRAEQEAQAGSVDGIVEGSVTWTFDPATGETVVTGSGTREASILDFQGYSSFPAETKSIRFENCLLRGSYLGLFVGLAELETIDFSGLAAEAVNNMAFMFSSCTNLANLDMSGFDTSQVKDMGDMFSGCVSLKSLDLSGFKTGNVTNMGGMFRGCTNLAALDLSGFDTGKVTWMAYMFEECHNLESLDVSGFDTASVTSMERMFKNCRNLASLDLNSFNVGNVQSVIGMLLGCDSLASLTVPGQFGSKGVIIELPGTYVDSEGNRTNALNGDYMGKSLARDSNVPNVSRQISGTINHSGSERTVKVELINNAWGTVTARVSYSGKPKSYHMDGIPAGAYTLRVSKPGNVTREYPLTVADTDVKQDVELQLLGDVNGDGTINARDQKLLYNHLEKIAPLSGYQFQVGDANGDGIINARDKKLLYNHIERVALLW